MSRSLAADAARREPYALGRLTSRQREVALLVPEGLSNAAIAELLVLREDTVKKYVSGILAALRCESRTQAALLIKRDQSASA